MVLFIGRTEKFLLYFSQCLAQMEIWMNKKREREREKEKKRVKENKEKKQCQHSFGWVIDGRNKNMWSSSSCAHTRHTLGSHSIFAELHSPCYLFKLTKRQQICFYINDSALKQLYMKSMRIHFESDTISMEL